MHRRLLAMHFVACVQATAGTAQHTLPPSEVVCKVTYRSAVASLLLYDVSGRNLQQDSAPACNQLRHSISLDDTCSGICRRLSKMVLYRSVVIHALVCLHVVDEQASLMLFLLAKTRVTNGTRTLAGWETCITWWSRFYACIYL